MHPLIAREETPEEKAQREQQAAAVKKAALEALLGDSSGSLNLLGGGSAPSGSPTDGNAGGNGAAGAASTSSKSSLGLGDIGNQPVQYTQKTSYDFSDDVVQGDRARPDGNPSPAPPPIERYPNIEAPDTVALGQEIAVQVSLTSDQIAPETKIISGAQIGGKIQFQMAAGENQWTLTVNLTAPGLEFSRGTNTADITLKRDGDSTLAVFYLRPKAEVAIPELHQDTKILATLMHDGAFIARLSRPLTIVNSAARPAAKPAAQAPRPAVSSAAAPAAAAQPPASRQAIDFNPDLAAPDLTIIENRVGNILRVTFITPHTTPVEADILDPDKLHDWISAHYAQMATQGRGAALESPAPETTPQYKADYIRGFGGELYDKFAPQVFKDLFWRLYDNSRNHSPNNPNAQWDFDSIQVLSDDPAIPWELMRPARADGSARADFLGLHFLIARWPLGQHGAARPPQSLVLGRSAVIAPVYTGARQLASAGQEMATLKQLPGFQQITGDYAAVRDLAMHPPQGIVHFAGHGAVLDKSGVPQFAILLQDTEMDPATWQSLNASASASTHPLYFFNACDVGESRRFLNDVDGWAPMLLSSGASGYIGALWPVGDSTAEAIAVRFYTELSGSVSTGHAKVARALADARAAVFNETSDPTALAYVFYGDPYLMLGTSLSPAAYRIPTK